MLAELFTFVFVVLGIVYSYRRFLEILSESRDSAPWTKPGTEVVEDDEGGLEQLREKLDAARDAFEASEADPKATKELSKACMRWAMAALTLFQATNAELQYTRKAVRAGYLNGREAHDVELDFQDLNSELEAVVQAAAEIKPGWDKQILPEAHRFASLETQQRRRKMDQSRAEACQAQQAMLIVLPRAMAEIKSRLAAEELMAEEEQKTVGKNSTRPGK